MAAAYLVAGGGMAVLSGISLVGQADLFVFSRQEACFLVASVCRNALVCGLPMGGGAEAHFCFLHAADPGLGDVGGGVGGVVACGDAAGGCKTVSVYSGASRIFIHRHRALLGAVFLEWNANVAFLCVAGAAMLVAAGSSGSSPWWADLPLVQWVGTRSYSAYLWHWPIVVGLRQSGLFFHPAATFLSILATLMLAHVSCRYIEVPARAWLNNAGRARSRSILWFFVVNIFGFCLYVVMNQGLPGRMSPNVQFVADEARNNNRQGHDCDPFLYKDGRSCFYGGDKVAAIVIGDSHAEAVVTAVAAAVPDPEFGVLGLFHGGCPFLKGVHINSGRLEESQSKSCERFVDEMLGMLKTTYPGVPVLIFNRWAQYSKGKNEDPLDENRPWVHFGEVVPVATPEFLDEFSERMIQTACDVRKNHPVYMLKPIPEMRVNVPLEAARSIAWGKTPEVKVSVGEYERRQSHARAAIDQASAECGVRSLDPFPALCVGGACSGLLNGRPLYFDDDHLSEFGNRLLLPVLSEIFH